MTGPQWHQTLRRAFRAHLFQFVGSFEMAVFFLVAPFNDENLVVFRQSVAEAEKDVQSGKILVDQRNGQIMRKSKDYVRVREVDDLGRRSSQPWLKGKWVIRKQRRSF